ncbi:MAG TPA: hypothetical protein VJV75_10650 [Candidatus Polarisedimenticolia bacterium]|nr:hypothetical protein [Candidatus Polarisedimenticolia bacterium]
MPAPVAYDVNDAPARRRFLDDIAPRLLTALRAETRPEWGDMSARQMVEHLAWVFDLSSGAAQVACNVWRVKQVLLKAFLYVNIHAPRHIRNPALEGGLPALRWPGLAEAIAEWNRARRRFSEQDEIARSTPFMHPVLGPLVHEEWSRFHFKHVYHHMRQFGLLRVA